MKYSPSTEGFYIDGVQYPDLPDDLTECTDDEHMQAVIARNSGKILSVSDGKIVISDPDPAVIAADQRKADLAQYRESIQSLLDRSDKVCMRCMKKGLPFPSDWIAWDNYLRSEISNDSADPTQPLSQTQPPYPAGT